METGFLKDVSLDTFVTQLPSIINYNNRTIEKEFEYIYDPSQNALVQSLYAPNGKVEAHWGNFKNIETEYITIKNPSTFQKFISNIPHNDLGDRFKSDMYEIDMMTYAHDASSIYVDRGQTLYNLLVDIKTRLDSLEATVKTLKNND